MAVPVSSLEEVSLEDGSLALVERVRVRVESTPVHDSTPHQSPPYSSEG
jgi:hypothetical protein